MGCDIHLHVEKRMPDGWHEIGREGEWYDGRSYVFFAALAGVRNNGSVTPIAAPRGLPDDLGPQVAKHARVDDEQIDTHSHSWLTVRELDAYDHWLDPDWVASVDRMRTLAEGNLDSVRIVFWFDN